MSEMDIFEKMNEIAGTPQFSMIFTDDSEQARKIAEHREWLKHIRHERPSTEVRYKVGVYIRYFNQTKYDNYLDFHKKQFMDTLALCPQWEFVDFYIDEGSSTPNMESAPAWCQLLEDCFAGKVDLIVTQKVSNVSKRIYEVTLWCMIYDDLSYAHEADIFANQQKFVKPLLPYEVFMANLEAGNDDQLMIRDLVESYGMTIGIRKGPGMICAVSTIEQIFKKYGYHGLNRVLRLIIGAWEGDVNSFSGNILNAVTRLVVVYGESLDDDVFKEKLGAVSIKQLTRTAKERRPGSMGFAEAMVLEYNGKKRSSANRLQINKLYAKEHAIFKELDDVSDDLLSDEEIPYYENDLFEESDI